MCFGVIQAHLLEEIVVLSLLDSLLKYVSDPKWPWSPSITTTATPQKVEKNQRGYYLAVLHF